MKTDKLCCRIFPIVILLVSLLIGASIWYFEEGKHSFSFLTDKNEIFNFLGSALFISIIPIGIFYLLNDKDTYRSKARLIALFGFLPALAWLLYILF